MSAPDIDQEVMDLFAAAGGDAHLTIILGAGASAPSGLPTWDQFARRLAVTSGLVATEDAASILLSNQDPAIVLEAACARSGENWTTFLGDALYGDLAAPPTPSPLHFAAAGHYLASPGTTTLATLNFDDLLESALLTDVPEVDARFDEDRSSQRPAVHHLHGAIFKDDLYEPVVGYRDFADLVAHDGAWQRKFLSDALARGPLLLAGTSYRDPDIRHWLHLIIRDEKPEHPALVTIVREGLGLGRETFETIDDALAQEWESIGLTAVKVNDLADVALVVRELQYIGRRSYMTPNDRARRVWSSHRKRFSRLQEEYSNHLTADAKTVSRAVGATALRGTLWLANGQGALGRWATEGSRFRGVRDLKLVPTGHDSPWIAGEAIGSEEVKLKDVHRNPQVSPTWRSVLAIPIFAGDGHSPDFATAVLTFGLAQTGQTLLSRQEEWWNVVEALSAAWGERLNDVAFPNRND